MKWDPTPSEPSVAETTNPMDPAKPLNPLTTVTTAHNEELSVLKSLNPQEAIAHEKHLQTLVKMALKRFMKGLNAEPDDIPLPKVMLTLIQKFKRSIKGVCDMVRWANHMEVKEAIEDPGGACIWDWDPDEQDQGEEDPPASASVQQETLQSPGINDLIKSLNQALTDEQAWMVTKLYRSHACMLEWQGQVSMLLGKLSTLVDHKTFLTITNTMVKCLHQITLLLAITTKLAPPAPSRHVPHNEWNF